MEASILIPLTLALALSLKLLHLLLFKSATKPSEPPLPPGPSSIAFFIKNVVLRKKSLFQLEQAIGELHQTYGPVVSLRTPANMVVFIEDRDVAHQALVQNSAAFADRPPPKEPYIYLTCDGYDINSARYGPLWRALRRNLASEVLAPSHIRLFGPVRQWTLRQLLDNLRTQAEIDNGRVVVMESFQSVIFCLSVAMCFGKKVGEKQVKELQAIHHYLNVLFTRFRVFSILPRITKAVFRKKWNEIVGVRRRQAEIFISMIRERREQKLGACRPEFPSSYIDSLLDLDVPKKGGGSRKLTEEEMVVLCHEFVSGSTETTATALEWIMAELVIHQEIQRKLAEEIETALPSACSEEIKEEDLQKMPYLKAVVTEGLRRHTPGQFLLPHATTEDVVLCGYRIPKGTEVLFNSKKMGIDERVWDDPLEFRPERFLGRGDEYSGEAAADHLKESGEIRMLPFGAGRRVCPGKGLGVLHLEYFVANLVREFEWKGVEGEDVDLSEELQFTTVMKNPLRAQIHPRPQKR